jgi:hypothetical protein
VKVEEVRAGFARPERRFGPTPFLGLNDDLDPDRLRSALARGAAAGWAGVFMHARTGLEVPYLSEAWWERIGVILEECRRLGIKAWIYDEYNWPSGPAGGRALEGHPEFLMPYLEYVRLDLDRGERPHARGRARAAFLTGDTIVDITEDIKDGRFEPDPERVGRALLFYEDVVTDDTCATTNAPWCTGVTGYLDLMNPAAVDHFISLTHRQYVRRFPEHVGTTVPGIFTDEPQLYRGFPWTAGLAEAFRAEAGYELTPRLYQLVEDRDDFRTFRNDYYGVVERLYAEAFYGRARRFCDEHGLIYTGHLGLEERLGELPVNHGGPWGPLRRFTLPGIDALGHGNPVAGGLVNMASPHFSPRAAAVAARVSGAPGVLCETGGGSGWEATLFSLKLQLDWLFASGVTFINPHQSLLSIKGLRKRDFPPFHSPAEPWFEFYRPFADYIARMSGLAEVGRPVVKIGMVAPMAALRSVCRGRQAGLSEEAERLILPFNAIMDFLVSNQRDFELVFEGAAAEGLLAVDGDRLAQADSRYEMVVVPPCRVIGAALVDILIRYLEAGGKLVLFDQVPRWDEHGTDVTERLLAPLRQAMEAGRAVHLSSKLGFSKQGVLAALGRLLPAEVKVAAPESEALGCSHRRGEDADYYFLANLAPAPQEAVISFREPRAVLERWDPATGECVRVPWRPEGGDGAAVAAEFAAGQSYVFAWRGEREGDGPHVVETDLRGLEFAAGKLKGLSDRAQVSVETAAGRREVEVEAPPLPLVLQPEWELMPEGVNALPLEPWNVRTDRPEARPLAGLDDEYYFTAKTRRRVKIGRTLAAVAQLVRPLWRSYRTTRYFDFGETERMQGLVSRVSGIDLARWGLYESIEAMTHVRDYLGVAALMQSFPPAGADYEARTAFTVDYVPEDLVLVYEDLGEPTRFEINGTPLAGPGEPTGAGWDAACRALPVAGLVRRGKNTLLMKGRQPNFAAVPPHTHSLEPVALMGSFAVNKRRLAQPGPARAAGGDWSRRGFPYYSGVMRLKTVIEVPEDCLKFAAVLELGEVQEAAEALVNGQSAGVRFGPPWHFPLAGLLRAGANELIVRVANTGANFFARPWRSGLSGPVRIAFFTRCEIDLEGG